MSVRRWEWEGRLWDTEIGGAWDGGIITDDIKERVVLESDYDALAARLAEAERLLEQWRRAAAPIDAYDALNAAEDATRAFFGMQTWVEWDKKRKWEDDFEERPAGSADAGRGDNGRESD